MLTRVCLAKVSRCFNGLHSSSALYDKNNYVEEIDILQIWRDISKSGKWSFINIQMLNY